MIEVREENIMERKFNLEDKIGDIVAVFPGASNLFLDYRIDFCCGGNRPLSVAIEEQKLDAGKIVGKLNESYVSYIKENKEYTEWAKESPIKLIDHILNTHHAYLKNELPRISELLFKILSVHGKKHMELFEIHKNFNIVRTELEEHLVKEEEFLFPLFREYEKTKSEEVRDEIIKTIEELEEEHTGAGDIIKRLRELTDHYSVPQDTCRTFETTYIKLMEFEKDIFNHIHLENNILFKNI